MIITYLIEYKLFAKHITADHFSFKIVQYLMAVKVNVSLVSF